MPAALLFVRISLLEKRELLSLLSFTCNYVVSVQLGFPLPLGAWDRLHYFIVSLPVPSI